MMFSILDEYLTLIDMANDRASRVAKMRMHTPNNSTRRNNNSLAANKTAKNGSRRTPLGWQ